MIQKTIVLTIKNFKRMKKIITLLLVMTGMAGTASATMYITGNGDALNNWSYNNPKEMTANGDGTYYFEFTADTATPYFCFSTAKGDSWDTFNGGAYRPYDGEDKSLELTLGTECTKVTHPSNKNSSYYVTLKVGIPYRIDFDPTNSKITIDVNIDKLYVIGEANGKSWAANDGIAMNKDSHIFTQYVKCSDNNTIAFAWTLGNAGDDWTTLNANRLQAEAESDGDFDVTDKSYYYDGTTPLKMEKGYIKTYKMPEGTFKLSVDMRALTVTIKKVESVTTNTSGYCTYVNTNPLTISGATAYYATDNNNGSATATAITNPAASTPMLIKGNASTTYYFEVAASGTSVDNNAFHAGTGSTLASVTAGKYNYILNGNTFYAANDKTVATKKAYLQLSAQAAGARPILTFADDEASAIKGITTVENTNDSYFNLQGVKVSAPTKGMYIRNGKKFIVK